jgi:S-adenosylmethionine:tRNA ribosyltransferase-isomerase
MQPADFHYDLPPELIAQAPPAERGASRLLHVPSAGQSYAEFRFDQMGELLRPDDLLVLNNTRVIPARLFGRKASGGLVEMLLERIIEPRVALVQLRANRAPGPGTQLIFDPDIQAEVEGREGRFYRLRFAAELAPALEQHGHIPLPPYITRADQPADKERYQTVYAEDPGAVAAPTAGLHFNDDLLQQLTAAGVRRATVTLHVGAGTFLPLEDEQLATGTLHSERVTVDERVCREVARARECGGRVVAVGTTVVRALESAAVSGTLRPMTGETDIFIRPGSRFNVVDAMVTNFHLPESSLLMLVSAFCSRQTMLSAYQYAIKKRFRFFSYGDAMFLERTA